MDRPRLVMTTTHPHWLVRCRILAAIVKLHLLTQLGNLQAMYSPSSVAFNAPAGPRVFTLS
jgi:ABC-type transporter Mla maintaining outer membrane lipid asymmetry permease subunit MlaE